MEEVTGEMIKVEVTWPLRVVLCLKTGGMLQRQD